MELFDFLAVAVVGVDNCVKQQRVDLRGTWYGSSKPQKQDVALPGGKPYFPCQKSVYRQFIYDDIRLLRSADF